MRTPARRRRPWSGAKLLGVPTHDVHVWFRATDALDEAAIAAAASVLSDEERARFDRFHFARDARDYAAAHALLRQTLSNGGNQMPGAWRFEKAPSGKPRIAKRQSPSFRLSHTRGMVACAVTSAEDGFDVEWVDREVDAEGIAARFFAPAEAAQLAGLKGDARRDRFFDLWTLKEALVKALGRGMAMSLSSLAFTVGPGGDIGLDAPDFDPRLWRFALFAPGPRHRLALAVERPLSDTAQLIFRSGAHEA